MKNWLLVLFFALPLCSFAQFTVADTTALTIVITDGTYNGKNSPQRPPGGKFQDPIRPMGMDDSIQAGAFVERPPYGKAGFFLIFCVNDAVGGKQGEIEMNGRIYKGIYRLIRQKMNTAEQPPAGMTNYKLKGTIFLLGVS